jgi:hypothetical protein
MPHSEKRQRPHRNHITARLASPDPPLLWHVSKQCNRPQPQHSKLIDQRSPLHTVRRPRHHPCILVEALQPTRESPPKPQCTIGKHPLHIVYMVLRLPHAPLPCRIPKQGPLLRHPGEQLRRLAKLPLHRRHGIISLSPVNVSPEESFRLILRRSSCHHPRMISHPPVPSKPSHLHRESP